MHVQHGPLDANPPNPAKVITLQGDSIIIFVTRTRPRPTQDHLTNHALFVQLYRYLDPRLTRSVSRRVGTARN